MWAWVALALSSAILIASVWRFLYPSLNPWHPSLDKQISRLEDLVERLSAQADALEILRSQELLGALESATQRCLILLQWIRQRQKSEERLYLEQLEPLVRSCEQQVERLEARIRAESSSKSGSSR